MLFPETLLSRTSTFNLNAVNIWRKIHLRSMPPFWMNFRCPNALQTSKTLSVYALLGAVLASGLPVAQFSLLRTGNKFQIKYGVHEAKRARTVKTTSQGNHQNRNIVEKKRKIDVQPNNRPSSLLGNAIHFR